MICSFARHAGVLAVVLGLAACSSQGAMSPEAMMNTPYAAQAMSLQTAPMGQKGKKGVRPSEPAGKAMASAAGLGDLLASLEAPARGTLGDRIDKLLAQPSPQLAGLGGIQARTALEVAKLTLNPGGGFGGKLNQEKVDVIGKIQEKVGEEVGFHFRPGEPMHVWVEVITTASRGAETVSRAEMFRVEIPAGAMRVEERTGSGGDDFPIFGEAAFGVSAARNPPLPPFDFKLWSVGRDIRVTDYWLDKEYSGGSPNYEKYTPQNAPTHLASIFAADADACFDMMFERNPGLDVSQGGALENGSFPPDFGPPKYCLGRCANPPIVNTR